MALWSFSFIASFLWRHGCLYSKVNKGLFFFCESRMDILFFVMMAL